MARKRSDKFEHLELAKISCLWLLVLKECVCYSQELNDIRGVRELSRQRGGEGSSGRRPNPAMYLQARQIAAIYMQSCLAD